MDALEDRLSQLQDHGVSIVDPRQTFVGPEVDLARICAGAVLFPGTRLHGARTFVGPGAQVGVEGPATLSDAVLAENALIDSGVVHGAVLLRGARLGANAHVRGGTLLEEQASTGHAVGLKHTVLLAFVTLGSLINFCDVLMAGGTSRKDHSEVGSGYIHFNYTPWGKHGDKATASLVGDVIEGVFLRSPRIFLGGSGGMVGPRRVEYGAIAAAGQVLRRDLTHGRMVGGPTPRIDVAVEPGRLDGIEPRSSRSVEYIAQLVALRAWYRDVRLARLAAAPERGHERVCLHAAVENIDAAIAERCLRLAAFLEERGKAPVGLELDPPVPCPLDLGDRGHPAEHLEWVAGLGEEEVVVGQGWLREITDRVTPR